MKTLPIMGKGLVSLASVLILNGCLSDDETLNCPDTQTPNGEGTACVSLAPYSVPLYLKGSFSGWSAEEQFQLVYDSDIYRLDNTEFAAGVHEFKVADENWTLETTFTADIDQLTQLSADTEYPLVTGEAAANMALVLNSAGIYDFVLKVGDDLSSPVFSYSEDIPPLAQKIYVRGGFNGWTSDDELKYLGDNKYQLTKQISPGNHEFKIAYADWSSEWVLDADNPVVARLDETYVLSNGGPNSSFFVTETGFYQFNIDASQPSALMFTVTETDGSGDVTIDPHLDHELSTELVYDNVLDDDSSKAKFSVKTASDELREYAQSTTQDLRDPGNNYVVYKELADQAKTRTGNIAFDALFALAINETVQNSVSEIVDDNYNGGEAIDCDCFETGAKWHYVWTRDLSYAANLGLALVDPQRVQNSLEFKLSPYREGLSKPSFAKGSNDGLQIVQDTGTGGSWPISTDRVAWALGAEKLLHNLTGDARSTFVAKAYSALVNTLENDRVAAFDEQDGLYRGEQSFLDWREQSYASWIVNDIASLGSSKALSTNVLHYKAMRLTESLANELGNSAEAAKYQSWANTLKIAINQEFWLADKGLYSSIIAGHQDTAPLYKFDWLGQALAVVSGIADETRAASVVANYPHGDLGAPVIFPQQPNIAIYHNRAVWPFVTAYGLKAAIATNNVAVADAAYDTLIRAASLNISNMENLEWLSLKPNLLDIDNPGLSGPVINSTRQLWSVGAYLGMVIDSVFGVHTSEDGLTLKPFITSKLRRDMFADSSTINLEGLTLRGHTINLQINLPTASQDSGYYPVQTVSLNGVNSGTTIDWSALADTNNIVINLADLDTGSSDITMVSAEPLDSVNPAVFAPIEPMIERVFLDNGLLAVEISDNQNNTASTYRIYRNGEMIASNQGLGEYKDSVAPQQGVAACYSAEAVFTSSGNVSHRSAPLCYAAGQEINVDDARLVSNVEVSPADTEITQAYLSQWGKTNDSLALSNLQVAVNGHYNIQLKYHNDHNAINLGVTNAVKWMVITNSDADIVAQGVVQMPHARTVNNTKPLVYSTPLVADLEAGTYSLSLHDFYNMSYLNANSTFTDTRDGATNLVDIAAIKIEPTFN
ncbi:Six-hairpin glycosidase-like protein [Agarivorans albus]|uniref:Six-hairpin glycosidase-like protein n=1 Tax=Agarivorans albus MKT 106 TaxID=1331007 RepID=R9PK18_AGAAL|nr:Six-hairpin glycosidase-like protein [Agarivorans albus]GAD01697.1 six-hairpin glycosidase-like protein [Agarivorans albus MKT 106]